MKHIKELMSDRICNSLMEVGIDYDTAYELSHYQIKEALKLLRTINMDKNKLSYNEPQDDIMEMERGERECELRNENFERSEKLESCE